MYMYVEEWEQIRTCADTCCPTQSQLSDEVMVSMYEKMSVLCYMDQHLYKAQRMVSCSARERISHGVLYCVQGLISFYMMSYGEEGTHFGSAAALHDKDMVYSQYREAGQLCTVLCVVPTTLLVPLQVYCCGEDSLYSKLCINVLGIVTTWPMADRCQSIMVLQSTPSNSFHLLLPHRCHKVCTSMCMCVMCFRSCFSLSLSQPQAMPMVSNRLGLTIV